MMNEEWALREAKTAFGQKAEISQAGDVFTIGTKVHGYYSGSSWKAAIDAYYDSDAFKRPIHFRIRDSKPVFV